MLIFNAQEATFPQDTANMLTLQVYLKHLRSVQESGGYTQRECSINVIRDTEHLNRVKAVAKEKKTTKLKYVIVIGIGGSNLGTKALYDALKGAYEVYLPQQFPKMLFLDTCDPHLIAYACSLLTTLSPEEAVVVAISKSGTTTETIANMEALFSGLWKTWKDRLVVITDEKSPFFHAAVGQGIATLTLPKLVGGRYSVFTAVGLFPLFMAGINVENVLQGAQWGLKASLYDNDANPALISAAKLYSAYLNGYCIHDTFVFMPALESMGKWYRQLLAESLGKEKPGSKGVEKVGLTPTVSVGSTDMHSVGQLNFAGPKNKITTFVAVSAYELNPALSQNLAFPLVEDIEGKTLGALMGAIYGGVTTAYKKSALPYLQFTFPRLSEAEVAAWMQIKMVEIMMLGELMGVNAFDQPHVELYKTETRRLLKER